MLMRRKKSIFKGEFRGMWIVTTATVALFPPLISANDDIVPLPRAHAHNDYEQERPLLDALDNGFCSVEADIWLIDGALLVAHDRDKVDPARTLDALYLKPLHDRVQANGGRVYANGPEFTLLIDIKSNGEETFPVLLAALKQYEDMLTTAQGEKIAERAVRAIVSGARPRALMEKQAVQLAAYDGRPDDIGGVAPASFIPLVSSSWASLFKWRGDGPMPAEEKIALEKLVNAAHAEGRKVRFWAIPHREELWQVLYDAGVDYINVDQLERLRDFLMKQQP